jgi:hypothetical protein
MKRGTKELIATAAAVVLFLVILFSQPWLVGGLKSKYKKDTRHCAGNGLVNDDLTCTCYSGFRGANCTLRYCPFGPSWAEIPVENNKRYRPNIECSNMGTCDMKTGLCECRPGFEGRACERCRNISKKISYLHILFLFLSYSVECATSVKGKTCSGHGRCLTMREAGKEFNGG